MTAALLTVRVWDELAPPNLQPRPIYVVRLRAEPGADGIRSLKAFLKLALRRYRLRCISLCEERKP